MPRNVEIKARVADLTALETRARAIATSGRQDLQQDDTFFAAARGRLKLREFADGTGQLIHYERPDATGPKTSDYVLAPVPEPATLRQALARAHGIIGRVRKQRRVYLVGRTRVHLDRVDGLGDFLELEVVLADGERHEDGMAEAQRILGLLGVQSHDLVEGAYLDLCRTAHPQNHA
jgi:adenylate cyclase